MEGPPKSLIKFHKHLEDQLKSRKTSKEIIAELKQMEIDVKNNGECVTQLKGSEDLGELAKLHIETHNERILRISGSILQVVIVEDNAKQIYDSSLQHKRDMETKYDKVNYYALFDVLKWCLDKGADPTIDQIHEISLLTVAECTTHDALLATVQVLKQLIKKYKNTDRVDEIYLNPVQCLWSVGQKLRTVVSEVIRASYNYQYCMKSRSVINMLVYVSGNDCEEDIETYFEEADNLLKKDMAESPVTKWVEENGKHIGEKFSSKKSQEEMEQEKELRWMVIKRNDNWLRRNVLHLTAIFCHDIDVLKCIPRELIKERIDEKDLNGCTPMDLALLHKNSAFLVFQSHTDRDSSGKDTDLSLKYNGCNDADLDTEYKNRCLDILKKSSVFEQMKNMLVLKVDECIQIENDLNNLFTKMLAEQRNLNAEIVMGGSVMEKLKVGRWNEFDLQICMKIKDRPYFVRKNADGYDEYETFACLRLHEDFVKGMPKVDDKMKISLQFASVDNPWKFVRGNGYCTEQEIFVDVVPIHVMIDDAQHRLMHMKWNVLGSQPDWSLTYYREECNLLNNLPPGCRLGILICKALLEALDHTSNPNLQKRRITSYMIKNTLLWLLNGKTPKDIVRCDENVMEERYRALRQRLNVTQKYNQKWMTVEDVEIFAEDGRFWAKRIFDAIKFLAREQRAFGSFLERDCIKLHKAHEVIDILDTCDRCLERLSWQVFFAGEACTSTADEQKQRSDSALRTELQKVINKLNEQEDWRSWRLWTALERLRDEFSVYRRSWAKQEVEYNKLIQNFLEKNKTALTKQKVEKCKALDKEIDKLLKTLQEANQKESVLFRVKGEIEGLEMNKNKDLEGQQPAGEIDTELTRKEQLKKEQLKKEQLKKEMEQLKKEIKELRHDKKWRENFTQLEKNKTEVFSPDEFQVPFDESTEENSNSNPLTDDETPPLDTNDENTFCSLFGIFCCCCCDATPDDEVHGASQTYEPKEGASQTSEELQVPFDESTEENSNSNPMTGDENPLLDTNDENTFCSLFGLFCCCCCDATPDDEVHGASQTYEQNEAMPGVDGLREEMQEVFIKLYDAAEESPGGRLYLMGKEVRMRKTIIVVLQTLKKDYGCSDIEEETVRKKEYELEMLQTEIGNLLKEKDEIQLKKEERKFEELEEEAIKFWEDSEHAGHSDANLKRKIQQCLEKMDTPLEALPMNRSMKTYAQNQAEDNGSQHHEESEDGEKVDSSGLTTNAQNQAEDDSSQHPQESEDGEDGDPLGLIIDAQNPAQENGSQHPKESEDGENVDSFGDAQNLAEDNRSQHHEESEDGEKVDSSGLTTDAQNRAQDNGSQHPEENEDGEKVDPLG